MSVVVPLAATLSVFCIAVLLTHGLGSSSRIVTVPVLRAPSAIELADETWSSTTVKKLSYSGNVSVVMLTNRSKNSVFFGIVTVPLTGA